MVVKFQKESQDLQAQLVEENSAKLRLQMELDSKDSEIEQLQQKLAMLCSETASLSSADNENEDLHAQGLLMNIMIKYSFMYRRSEKLLRFTLT